jgi:nicotinate dehydrogenase subunit B
MKTVTKGNFVGVVAENEWAAIRAAKELKVNWSSAGGFAFPGDLYSHMRIGSAQRRHAVLQPAKGDAAAALATLGQESGREL